MILLIVALHFSWIEYNLKKSQNTIVLLSSFIDFLGTFEDVFFMVAPVAFVSVLEPVTYVEFISPISPFYVIYGGGVNFLFNHIFIKVVIIALAVVVIAELPLAGRYWESFLLMNTSQRLSCCFSCFIVRAFIIVVTFAVTA